ncbi:CaiB/BaiF CoA transferase family protein [Acuticoccus mangrovi]|uniref:CaiB/BaiF CoA transferase family protein n=1 Tax=Acuticoccus mangrovi TaxID=2796142 RepID=UPI0018E9BCF9
MEPTTEPPLARLRVLDFTRVIAGPYLTAMLADLGADVVKVEDPVTGDDARTHYPPGKNGEASIFLALNRSKRSVAINLATEEGRALAARLAATADVLVENFRPGTMARFGLDADRLIAANPRLVYCALSGYGYTSRFGPLPGYDPIIQAETGYMYMTGDASMPPIRAGGSVIDILTGVHGALAIVAALKARETSGRGQFIDVSLFDTALSSLGYMLQGPLVTGENPERLGNTSFFMAPNGLYDCADGKIMLSAGNNRLFAKLCGALGVPEMAQRAAFASNAARLANLEELTARLSERLATRTRAEWIATLREHGVPAGAVRTPLETLASPEAEASGMLHDIEHPVVGAMRIVGNPLHLSSTPAYPPRPAPRHGEHTEEALADWLGAGAGELASLRRAGAIGTRDRGASSAA